ncbi:hypothetical protein SDC9_91417 [bioreactor metagenome]|uniref:Uncharacterized protein n=1 Tax=bioreactor metagenome TaxID=1076179 RepID=A0A644ZVK3_9ZZZZ
MCDRIVQSGVIQFGALGICNEIGGVIGLDSHGFCCANGIDIRTEKEKFPAELSLLSLNQMANSVHVVFATGIFHAIGRNHKEHFLCSLCFDRMFLNQSDFVNGFTNGIEQCGRAANEIILFR